MIPFLRDLWFRLVEMPTKNRRAIRPEALLTVPARKVGMEPASKTAAKVYRGPTLSHIGPATNRMRSVAVKAMMLELAT